MILHSVGREYKVDIEVGQKVRHTTFGWGTISYISPYPETMCPIKVHFEHLQKYVRFTVTGKEFITQLTPVIDFGACEVPKPKESATVKELIDDLVFLRREKPELGMQDITYSHVDKTVTIKLN